MKNVMIRMKTGEIGNGGFRRPQETEAARQETEYVPGATDEIMGTEL